MSVRLQSVLSTLLIMLGTMVITGWLAHLPLLVQPFESRIAIVFNTAIGFLLSGSALWPIRHPRLRQTVSITLGIGLITLSSLTLAEWFLHRDLGMDQFFFRSWLNYPPAHPGRMAPNTAFGFLLTGLALCLTIFRNMPWPRFGAQVLSVFVFCLGLLGFLGYALRLDVLYGWLAGSQMALFTSMGFLILGILLWQQTQDAEAAQRNHLGQRILLVNVSLLASAILISGLTGFYLLQKQSEDSLKQILSLSLQNRVHTAQDAIDHAQANLEAVSKAPWLFSVFSLDKNSDLIRKEIALNLASLGFSGFRIVDRQGRTLLRHGEVATVPDMALPLGPDSRSWLGWKKGFVFIAQIPLRHGKKILGTLRVEHPLPMMNYFFSDPSWLGSTGEMVLCGRSQGEIHCFPSRITPHPFSIPEKMQGQPLPITHALTGKTGVMTGYDYRNHRVVAAYAPLNNTALGFALKKDRTELFAPIRRQLQRVLPVLFGMLGLGMLALRWQLLPLLRRLMQAEETARHALDELWLSSAEVREINVLLEDKIVELTASNRALDAFNYSVSHDLRAPLRAIDGFSHLLLDDYAIHLDDTGKTYLHRIRLAAQRMGNIMDAQLKLSRLARVELRLEQVDLSQAAQEILTAFRAADPDRPIELSIAPHLSVQGDRRMLHLMLEHLLGNAWKFSASRKPAHIAFGSKEEKSGPVYYVCDNGVGFDMKYADKLFGAFQRLHAVTEFEGVGIGLAIVQRIIQRHDGMIWAESRPNEGTTLYFTLPPDLISRDLSSRSA